MYSVQYEYLLTLVFAPSNLPNRAYIFLLSFSFLFFSFSFGMTLTVRARFISRFLPYTRKAA